MRIGNGECGRCGQAHPIGDLCPTGAPDFLQPAVDSPDDIVGHKTLSDGSHEPLRRDEAEALWASCEAKRQKRATDMPDERAAIDAMFEAWQRLKELGWREAIYCPKDGSGFLAIEPGSTGIFETHYSGEWPKGSWWAEDGGDLWPARPCLFKLHPEDQAKYDARMVEACARYAATDWKLSDETVAEIERVESSVLKL